jgi:uncharacterized iron-regulated protein
MSIKININDKQFAIPDRLTVAEYSKAIQFDWSDSKYYPMIISQLTGAPLLLMSKANDEILHLGMGFVVKSMNDRKECKMLDLESLTFGQWVDLDVYLTGGLDTNIEKIIEILTPDAKWADEAMWAIDQYAAFRTYIYRQYSVLFGINQKETFDELEPENKDKQANARAWYKIIVGLANGDILKLDEVTEQPLKKTLNFMSLQKEQQLEENQRKLKERRQYDLQRNRR